MQHCRLNLEKLDPFRIKRICTNVKPTIKSSSYKSTAVDHIFFYQPWLLDDKTGLRVNRDNGENLMCKKGTH